MKPLLTSFAGGEIVEEMHSRLSLVKRQTGLALAENVLVQPAGPVEKTPGTVFISSAWRAIDAAAEVGLIPVSFSDTATYVAEVVRLPTIGTSLVSFLSNGAVVLNATALSFTSLTFGATTGAVFSATSVTPTLVYITTPSNPSHPLHNKLWQYNHSAGKLRTVWGTEVDSSAWPAHTWNAGAGDRVYQRLTVAVPATLGTYSGELRDVRYALRDNMLTLVHPSWDYAVRVAYAGGSTPFSAYLINHGPRMLTYSSGASAVRSSGAGTLFAHSYQICPVSPDGLEEAVPNVSYPVDVDLTVATVTVTVPSTAPQLFDDAGLSAANVAAVANVYRRKGGVYGFIGQVAAGGSIIDDNIVPDLTRTPPNVPASPGVSTGDKAVYGAAATAFWNQRQWYGGPTDGGGTGTAAPLGLVATKPGTFRDTSRRAVTVDDDAIYTTLLTKVGTSIRHLVGLDELIAFTASGILRIGNGQEGATPTIGARTIANIGSTDVVPVETPSSVVFVGSTDGHVWHLRYTNEGGGYRVDDMCLFATHLFDGYSIVKLAFTRGRAPIVWAVRSDGVLLACTYIPEQEITAWARASVSGSVVDVVSVPENGRDVLYLQVDRTINGSTRRCVERMDLSPWSDREDAYYVNSGLTYDGSAVSAVSGLWHLEGEAVKVVADGAVYERTVSGGEIDLEVAASVVHVGLAYTSRIKTLPLILEQLQAGGTANVQIGSHAWVSLVQSLAVRYGVDFDTMFDIVTREYEAMGSPPNLVSGVHEVILGDAWDYETALCLESQEPLPFTIRAIAVATLDETRAA